MGIKGLLPFLKDVQKPICLRDLRPGSIVAVDAYVWLHKTAHYNAEQIMFNNIPAHLESCTRYIDLLIYSRLVPVLVFDGLDLPGKKETDEARRCERENFRNMWNLNHLIKNRPLDHKLLRRSIEIDHKIAHPLIQLCQAKKIHYIVAPYEADAQIAFLAINNLVDYVLTEDSDLLVYGCPQVIYKLNTQDCTGMLIEIKNVLKFCDFQCQDPHEKFRYMSILAGCDYVKSLKGMGIKKAYKFISENLDCDMESLLYRIFHSRGIDYEASKEYMKLFKIADIIFQFQIVFNPNTKKQQTLNEITNQHFLDNIHHFIGSISDNQDEALDFSCGNIDPQTNKKVSNFKMLSFESLNGSQLVFDREFEILIKKHRSSMFFQQKATQHRLNSPKKQIVMRNQQDKFSKDFMANLSSPYKRSNDSDGHCNEMFSHSSSEIEDSEITKQLLTEDNIKPSMLNDDCHIAPQLAYIDDKKVKDNIKPITFMKVSKYFQLTNKTVEDKNSEPNPLLKSKFCPQLAKIPKIMDDFKPPRFLDKFRP